MKTKLRFLIILSILATLGVVAFQIKWLTTSYEISKEKLKVDASRILDNAIVKHKELVADTVRDLLKKAISPKDIETRVIRKMPDSENVELGFRTKRRSNASWVGFNFSRKELEGVQNNFYLLLLKRINEDNLDDLDRVYSPFVGTVDYTLGSREEILQDSLMRCFMLHNDTTTLIRILKEKFKVIHHNLTFSVTHLEGFDEIYKGGATLTQKMDSLAHYTDKLNTNENHVYVSRLLLDDIDTILQENISVFILAVKVPRSYLLSQMLFSVISSAILLLLIGFCLIYMFYTILKQKKLSEIKDDFMSNVSHELKTPVATTLAAIHGMQHFEVLKDEEKTEQYLATAAKEMKRLSGMIDTILNNAIYERSDFELHYVKFNLKEMMTEIIENQETHSKKKVNIELAYQAREEFFADQTHLYNVILNLIDNSIKYGRETVNIKISCSENNLGLQIHLIDNGMGIPVAYQKNIFDKFFRVPNPNDHRVKGYGLGLSYVKKMVEKHNGTIKLVKSGPTTGTSFEINLPQ